MIVPSAKVGQCRVILPRDPPFGVDRVFFCPVQTACGVGRPHGDVLSLGSVTVPEARQHPRLGRYRLRRLRVPVGAQVLDLVVPDAEHHQRLGAWTATVEGSDEPPYWMQLWPASLAAARLLVRHQRVRLGCATSDSDRAAPCRVLDLGCGLGLPGIAAASLGAEVCFADLDPDALAFAAWNATRLHPAGVAPRICRFDWDRDRIAGHYDVVVLADVSYRPRHHPGLWQVIRSNLKPGGIVLHADPKRRESDAFVARLSTAFACQFSEVSVVSGPHRQTIRLCLGQLGPGVTPA